jgi:uncharacterized protein YbjT (DUF2867 family)
VLREAVSDPDITEVVSVVRRATGEPHELVHADMTDFSAIADRLKTFDACLWCLGVSSAGMSETDYRAVTYDLTLAAAKAMAHPGMRFVFVTGVGTDGKSMWARVKKATEDALLAMPFAGAYMIRPGYIQPRHGVKSRTPWTRRLYAALGWLYPVVKLFTKHAIDSDVLARGMLRVAKQGGDQHVLYSDDLQ